MLHLVTIKILRSSCIEGNSKSSLFLNHRKWISIIGVLVKGIPLMKEYVHTTNVVGNTTAISIEHVFKILNSKQMRQPVLNGLDKTKAFDQII